MRLDPVSAIILGVACLGKAVGVGGILIEWAKALHRRVFKIESPT